MNQYNYQNKHLYLESVAIADIAQQVPTPFYVYSQNTIEDNFKQYQENLTAVDALICFALKANSNQAIIKILADLGAGADVVSVGELRRALKAGIPANKIVYSGVAKTRTDISFALEANILQFNVESTNELALINEVALEQDVKARIAFRINPDVDARTHEKISTGKAENKFGIPITIAPEIYSQAAAMKGIQIQGVDMHIGSQLTQLEPFEQAFELLYNLVSKLLADGHPISYIDLGGGLGVDYEHDKSPPSIADYCNKINTLLADWDGRVIIEPGRSIVAESGLLISSVIYIKQGQTHQFCILDAAMNDLLRPSMYGAHHMIVPVTEKTSQQTYDVVGPVCETGDTFARNYQMATVEEGDLVAFTYTGAYGAVMSSNYNSRLTAPEVLVRNDEFYTIKPRLDYEQLIGLDQTAPWQ